MPNPSLNPAVLLIPLENGYAAYDPKSDKLHELNPVASLIVELCDGSRPAEEICSLVVPILPQGSTQEVQHWIDNGVSEGLLTLEGGAGNAHRELSAEELHKVSRRLRDRDKEEIAFVCQQRATELAPGDPDQWYDLGDLAYGMGRRQEARAAFERYLELKPDDPEIRHILVAMRDEPAPARVPNDAIEHIYTHFSTTYEATMRDELGYKGPQRIAELIDPILGDRANLQVLDLGCGTGFAGLQFKPRAARLIGVDLSPQMIELARARNLYDRLDLSEITGWLAQSSERFDLALACDCLIYFGDLRQVALPLAGLLCPHGLFAFTVEASEQYPHRLGDSGRYAHHPGHIREVAAEAGMKVARLEEGLLRTECGNPVGGLFAVLQK